MGIIFLPPQMMRSVLLLCLIGYAFSQTSMSTNELFTTLSDSEASSLAEAMTYIYIPPIILSFFLGVLVTICCRRCCARRQHTHAYQTVVVPYEQAYPVEHFAQQV